MAIKDFFKRRAASKQGEAGKEDKVLFDEKKRAASKQGEAGKEDKVLFDEKKRAASKQGEAGKEDKDLFDEKKRAASKQGEAGKEDKDLFDEKAKPKKVEAKTERPKFEKRKKTGEPWRVLKSPHVTEKAGSLSKENDYVFKIFNKANKKEVKDAIEHLFGVEVVSVKIINVPSKKRRLGRIKGIKSGYKKAIAKIKKGQKIEILSH